MQKRVKLEDIAKKAGVSKMSVSLALRNDPSISEKTTENVKKIAAELGYVSNRIAKGLVSGRTYTIAAMISGDLHDDYHNQFLSGAVDYAINRGYTLTIVLTEKKTRREAEMIEKMRQMMADGFLCFPCSSPDNYIQLKKHGTPFVLYTKYFQDLDFDHIVCDDIYGASLLTQHFIELGHKRIAFVYDNGLANSSEIQNRIQGYKDTLQQHGIALDETLIMPYELDFNTPETFEENAELLRCLRSGNAPTAVFVCNDIVAAAFCNMLKRIGYNIPEDISVGGYEGVYIGQILDPPLTTVSTPIREMGQTACRLLIDKIEGRTAPDTVTKLYLEPKLTVRKSTAKTRFN